MASGDQPHNIRHQYVDYIRLKNIRFYRIGILLGLAIISYLAYSDIYITGIPAAIALPWRAVPILTGLISLGILATPLKRSARLVGFLYGCGLASLLVMMYGLLFQIRGMVDTRNFEIGLFLDMFLIFVFANGGTRFLLPVYGIPLAVFICFQAVFQYEGNVLRTLLNLTNEMIATIVLVIFSGAVEKLRFSEFETRMILEHKNELIEGKNRQLEKDLELARSIQKSLMPKSLPEFPRTRLSMVYHPMDAVGGDSLDFFILDGGKKLGIFIGDVSGHGVPAALIAGMIKALNESCEDALRPGKLLQYLNTKLVRFLKNHFVTALYAVYDPGSRQLTYARGGHMYPLLVRDGSVRELQSGGLCLGRYGDISFEEASISLVPGDKLLFYTDGLTETVNSRGQMYEDTLYSDLPAVHTAGSSADFAHGILDSLEAFAGRDNFRDDICIVGLEIL